MVLPMVESLFWNVLLFPVESTLAVFVEFAPLLVLFALPDATQPETHLVAKASGDSMISPFWSSTTLNSDIITASVFVLTAVIAVPEVLALPVFIVVLPTLKDD